MGIEKARITFRSEDPGMSFTCWLGTEPTTPTGGYGGWTIIDRPRRIGVTQWNGRQPIQMDIHIVMDDFYRRGDVELECSILEKMAWPADFPANTKAPPVIKIECDAIPHGDLPYVIADLQWGSNVIRANSTGKRQRQDAVVSVIRYLAVDKMQLSAAQNARNNKPTPKPKLKIGGVDNLLG